MPDIPRTTFRTVSLTWEFVVVRRRRSRPDPSRSPVRESASVSPHFQYGDTSDAETLLRAAASPHILDVLGSGGWQTGLFDTSDTG